MWQLQPWQLLFAVACCTFAYLTAVAKRMKIIKIIININCTRKYERLNAKKLCLLLILFVVHCCCTLLTVVVAARFPHFCWCIVARRSVHFGISALQPHVNHELCGLLLWLRCCCWHNNKNNGNLFATIAYNVGPRCGNCNGHRNQLLFSSSAAH